MSVRIINADMREALRDLAADGVQFHSCVTDPPYHLTSIVKRFGKAGSAPAQFGTDGAYARASRGFMGKEWDGGDIAFQPETWRAVYDVLLPGAHLLAFSGTRTYHRMACAIEDAGFEIRDQIGWMFGSGFPKSHNVGSGWGTALKPAWEPIVVSRKPLIGSVAANVLAHGCGAMNIDACRIPGTKPDTTRGAGGQNGRFDPIAAQGRIIDDGAGRFPANVIHDGSPEVEEAFAAFGERVPGRFPKNTGGIGTGTGIYGKATGRDQIERNLDGGSASRFFKSCPYSEEEWNASISANDAALIIDLQNERAVSALSNAVEQSTQLLELSRPSYQAPSTSVLASALRMTCALVTALIQDIELSASLGLPPERLTLSSSLVECVATPRQTGITTITANLPTFDGSVANVTFNITPLNSGLGGRGLASRFHYSAKADKTDRAGSKHPTVKPTDLMRYLVQLVTPPGGTVLDPFAGSGSTGLAADQLGMNAVLIERDPEYAADIERKITSDAPLFAEVVA